MFHQGVEVGNIKREIGSIGEWHEISCSLTIGRRGVGEVPSAIWKQIWTHYQTLLTPGKGKVCPSSWRRRGKFVGGEKERCPWWATDERAQIEAENVSSGDTWSGAGYRHVRQRNLTEGDKHQKIHSIWGSNKWQWLRVSEDQIDVKKKRATFLRKCQTTNKQSSGRILLSSCLNNLNNPMMWGYAQRDGWPGVGQTESAAGQDLDRLWPNSRRLNIYGRKTKTRLSRRGRSKKGGGGVMDFITEKLMRAKKVGGCVLQVNREEKFWVRKVGSTWQKVDDSRTRPSSSSGLFLCPRQTLSR